MLEEYLDTKAAEDYGILPEQYTTEFVHFVRAREEHDIDVQRLRLLLWASSDRELTDKEQRQVRKIIDSIPQRRRQYAQEFLKKGSTPCTR